MNGKPTTKTIVLKYGGNAMTDEAVKKELIRNICGLKQKGIQIIIVHGGGPFIQQSLDEANIESEFIDGQRKTSEVALERVEMALKGKVNGNLVNLVNSNGIRAIGLSGKDGKLVIARKRYHIKEVGGSMKKVDLGQVGDVAHVNTELLHLLMDNDYLPVITCIASDEFGHDYNINGDVFAGYIAAALQADEFIVLTDVDGLMTDIHDPHSLIHSINMEGINKLINSGVIKGGMIPKIEACTTSLKQGAKSVRIINGTAPEQLLDIANNKEVGTVITK